MGLFNLPSWGSKSQQISPSSAPLAFAVVQLPNHGERAPWGGGAKAGVVQVLRGGIQAAGETLTGDTYQVPQGNDLVLCLSADAPAVYQINGAVQGADLEPIYSELLQSGVERCIRIEVPHEAGPWVAQVSAKAMQPGDHFNALVQAQPERHIQAAAAKGAP